MRTASSSRYNLGPVTRIPVGEGRTFRVGDQQVAVFRTRDGGVFATQAGCPHRTGPLAEGIVGGRRVVCPLHGYTFDLITGKPVGNLCGELKTYRVAVDESGDVVLGLDESIG